MNEPEIGDADATGETARIFAEIKGAFRFPIANQIYRRLAAVPGGLDWAWSLIRPVHRSGELEKAARQLVQVVRLDQPNRTFVDDLVRLCADDDLKAEVAAVLDAYNRSNPMNLIAVKLLDDALGSGRAAPTRRPLNDRTAESPISELPPLVDIDVGGPDLRNTFLRLARQASGGGATIIPTLFRHLGRWPDFLALAAAGIDSLVESGALAGAAKDLETAATAAAGRLRTDMSAGPTPIPPPIGRDAEAMRLLFKNFPPAISRMIVIGAWLRRAVPE